eukprot:evm.model.scf_11.28 EVM.evm.TU.scf_11.28   scf_11:243670-247412(+)
MAEQAAQEPATDWQDLPAVVKVDQQAEVWRDVLDFKVRQQRTAAEREEGGSAGRRSGGWEIVGCSHASECGSPARTIPGSEFGFSDHAGGQTDLTPAFQEAHARALAEIEALEAAERQGDRQDYPPRGATPLPVSTDDGQLAPPQPAQVLSVSSGSACGTPLASGHFGDLGIEEVLEVAVLSEGADEGLEAWDCQQGEGYVSGEEVGSVGGRSARSEPDSREAMVDLQEMSQEGSLDGSYWPECGAEEVEVLKANPLPGVDSFEDIKSTEGAFSELSFESPKCAQRGIQPNSAVEELPKLEAPVKEESDAALTEEGKSLEVATDLAGGLFWMWPRVHQIVQRWTALAMGLLPSGMVPHWLSMADVAMPSLDWKGVAYGAGLAVLSAMVVGLVFQNRRLHNEVRKKQEEVTRLMKAVMNFQELWSTHRTGKTPILRHTNFTHIEPHHQPF